MSKKNKLISFAPPVLAAYNRRLDVLNRGLGEDVTCLDLVFFLPLKFD